MKDTILHGDCLARLRELPAESVQCIVTSPPYFGLRDYGTAQWVGGSPECDHREIRGGNGAASAKQVTSAGTPAYQQRSVCKQCGATRQDAQIGLEETPEQYVAKVVEVFREARRVLRKDGVLWLNLGDSYSTGAVGNQQSASSTLSRHGSSGVSPYLANLGRSQARKAPGYGSKQLLGMPWRVAFALQSDGWILRADCIWHKPNCMPESVKDRPTKAHEYLFLFAKSERYYYDADAVKEGLDRPDLLGKTRRVGPTATRASGERNDQGRIIPYASPSGRNKRTVWTIATQPYKAAHFATMPPALVEPCILAGSRAGDIVLDPFAGAGTVPMVARQHGRSYLGIELNASYIALAEQRIAEAIKPRAKILKLPKRATGARQPSLWEVTA